MKSKSKTTLSKKDKTNNSDCSISNIVEKHIDSNDLIKINKYNLIKLLECYLCKGIFRSPYTINECMDTFCKACIFKYFYNSNSSCCPKCNMQLGGKPLDTLVVDHSLNTMINILFPQFDDIDMENTEAMYKAFRDKKMQLPGDPNIHKHVKPSVLVYFYPETFDSEKDKINYSLPKIKKNNVLVPPKMDVHNLKSYIADKLKDSDYNIDSNDIVVKYKENELNDDYTIYNIEKIYKFPSNKDEKIKFRYRKTTVLEKEKSSIKLNENTI